MKFVNKISAVFVLVLISACFIGFDVFAAPLPMPVISRGVPAYAATDVASNANDSNYSTMWKGSIPDALAYDLSSVSSSSRGQVVIAWYNPDTYDYDYTIKSTGTYGSLAAYTVEANAAAGGTGSAPSSGWVVLATVSGNVYHSRQHVVNLSGYNWVRLNVTAAGVTGGGTWVSINCDVHNASQGVEDDWIFYGDSITAGGMNVNGNGNGCFGQLINTKNSSYFPAAEGGGIGSLFSYHLSQNINTWLALFPGKYVGIAYGTNDAWGNQTGTANYYTNLSTAVSAVIAAGKIPVVSKIPWSSLADVANNVPSYNAKIDELYAAYPSIVPGPDFWTYFQSNPSLISSDGVHPTSDGYIALRQLWADTVYSAIYSGTAPTSVPTSVTTTAPTDSPTADPTAAPNDTLAPTDVPTATPVPTDTPAPTSVPTATPYGVTADPTAPPTVTTDPTAPPSVTPDPTTPPSETTVPGGCTCANLCSSQTAITVPFTYDGSGEYCWTSSSIATYVNSWNADSVVINNIICTNSYVLSSTITAIGGVYYIYYKGSYGWSHIEIK